MNDKFEKQLKELLPYIIISGVIFLLLPLFMGKRTSAATYIIQIGAFPLTAVGCGVVYRIQKGHTSVPLCLIAPLFYALTAMLYRMWQDWYTVLVYIAAYFLSGWLGLMLGDVLPFGSDAVKTKRPARPPKSSSVRPRRVKVEKEHSEDGDFAPQGPAEDLSLDASSTEDDIEAILKSIHDRRSQ